MFKILKLIFFLTRFGRRPLLLVSYLSSFIFAALSAFSSSYIMFVIMRFFTGMSLAGISIISIALSKKILFLIILLFQSVFHLCVCILYGLFYFLDLFFVVLFLQMWNGAALNAEHFLA